jgi:hypothetical protein
MNASRILMAAVAAILVGLAIGCTKPHPYRISQVMHDESATALYLQFDLAKADLPWILQRSKIRITAMDGPAPQAVAFGMPKVPLAFGVGAVSITRSPDGAKLAVEIQGGQGDAAQLRTLPRAAGDDEVAILVEPPAKNLKSLEIELGDGRLISVLISHQ